MLKVDLLPTVICRLV